MSKTITVCEGYLLRICNGSFYNDTFIFSGVSVWSSNPGSIHLGIKMKREKKKQEKELVALQEHMESFKDETDSLWRTHAIPFKTALPTPISSSRHHCVVSMNIDRLQEYKTALMLHLLKQQDFHIVRLCAEPLVKLP